MGREINIAALVASMVQMQGAAGSVDAVRVMKAMAALRETVLPAAYLDGLQDELLQMLRQSAPPAGTVSVYLAFHGADDRATCMKIGIARSVSARMRGLSTGNPLPRLWVYKADFPSRRAALKVEGALLDHMGADRIRGEWVRVGGLSDCAARAVVESLAEVASRVASREVAFTQHEVWA